MEEGGHELDYMMIPNYSLHRIYIYIYIYGKSILQNNKILIISVKKVNEKDGRWLALKH